jgi:hypothetical protein
MKSTYGQLTSTPPRCSFAFTRPYVNVHFNLFLPRRPFEAAHYIHGLGHSKPCQWAVVTSQAQQYRERKHFLSGRMASGHLLLVCTQRQTDGQL